MPPANSTPTVFSEPSSRLVIVAVEDNFYQLGKYHVKVQNYVLPLLNALSKGKLNDLLNEVRQNAHHNSFLQFNHKTNILKHTFDQKNNKRDDKSGLSNSTNTAINSNSSIKKVNINSLFCPTDNNKYIFIKYPSETNLNHTTAKKLSVYPYDNVRELYQAIINFPERLQSKEIFNTTNSTVTLQSLKDILKERYSSLPQALMKISELQNQLINAEMVDQTCILNLPMHSCNLKAKIVSHGTGEAGVDFSEVLAMLEWKATSYSVIGCPSYSFESHKELYRQINGVTSYPNKYDDFSSKLLADTHSLLADDVRGELFEPHVEQIDAEIGNLNASNLNSGNLNLGNLNSANLKFEAQDENGHLEAKRAKGSNSPMPDTMMNQSQPRDLKESAKTDENIENVKMEDSSQDSQNYQQNKPHGQNLLQMPQKSPPTSQNETSPQPRVPSVSINPTPISNSIEEENRVEKTRIWQGFFKWQDYNEAGVQIQQQIHAEILQPIQDKRLDSARSWPQQLQVIFTQQKLLCYIKEFFNHSMWVALKFDQTEAGYRTIQQKVPQSQNNTGNGGGAGIITIPKQSPNGFDEVIVLVCNSKTQQYIGLIPNDQARFIQQLQNVLTRHKAGGPQTPVNQQSPQNAQMTNSQNSQNPQSQQSSHTPMNQQMDQLNSQEVKSSFERRKSDEIRMLSQDSQGSNLSQGSQSNVLGQNVAHDSVQNSGNQNSGNQPPQNIGLQNKSNPSPSPQNTMLPSGNINQNPGPMNPGQNFSYNQQNNPNLTRLLGSNPQNSNQQNSNQNNNFQR